ncbi:mechanosensitive ion channel domain-containing protein [Azospirillum sp. SYSU D00513]|uniref:mechanosensitive ion channel domain-containing protein n=1 Tax=Azospirillum sp. SYSU D00513 TaxID=2812561 RepID=UPI001A97BA8B
MVFRRFPFLALLLSLALSFLALPNGAGAQAPATTPQAAAAPASAPGTPAADPRASLEAVDRVLSLLKDAQSRDGFVAGLEQLRASLAAQAGSGQAGTQGTGASGTAPAGEAAEDAENSGLLGAISTGLATAGQDLPGVALGDTLDGASVQLRTRLERGVESGALERFAVWAGSAWALALAAWGLSRALIRRRRGRWLPPPKNHQLLRSVLVNFAWSVLPVAAAVAVLAVWPVLSVQSPAQTRIMFMVAAPVVWAALVREIVNHGLMLTGPTRGWRLVAYSQRRVVPLIATIAGAAIISGVLKDPVTRITIGYATADVLSLLLDLTIGGLAIWFIVRHRRAVRHLMVRRHGSTPAANEPLHRRVLARLAARWHVLGFLFVGGNLLARMLRLGGGWSILSAMAAIFVVILGLAVALTLDRYLLNVQTRLDARRHGSRHRFGARMVHTLRVYAQAFFTLAIVFGCLRIWGIDLIGWFSTDLGWRIATPILSMAAVLTAGWLLWITVDSVIEHALTPVDSRGRPRPLSNRVRTLLPLLRNVAFVVLCVLTVIAVLANLGLNVAPLLAGAGVVGLAVGFGSQQLVQDLITGLFILFEDTISVGDVIDTGDRAGTVESITIRTVRVRDGEGALHTIPFSQIKALKNRSRDYGVFMVKVPVDYGADPDQVMATMREVGAELQADPAFAINMLAPLDIWGVDQFAPEGVVIMGALRTRPLQQWGVGREYNRRLKRRFDELGISLQIPRMALVNEAVQDNSLPPRPQGSPAAAE